MYRTRVWFAMLFLGPVGWSYAADERLPVPSADEQAKSEKLIRQLFKADYAIRTSQGYKALAGKLMDQAANTKDDATARYVLFREAGTLGAVAGDLDLALNAAGQLAREYQTSGPLLKSKIFETMASYFRDPNSSKTLAENALMAIGEAIENDDYDPIPRLLKVAETTARNARSVPLISGVQARAKEIDGLKAEYEKIKKTLAILQDKPEDPDANLVAGKYFCLQKGNWERGLPFLAKGNDAKLKEMAAWDLAKPKEAPGQVGIGEAWFAAGEKEKDPVKKQLQWRARFWFEQAVAGATGETRTKLEMYLKDIPPREGTALTKVYLSDMDEFDVKVGFGKFGKKGQLGYGQRADSLSVNGQKFPNAISTHPPEPGNAVVKYKLNKTAKEFRAVVALNDTAQRVASPITFIVLGDGKELWTSKAVQKSRIVQECSVNVSGVEVLELRVHCPGSYGDAHAVWLDPYILTTGTAPAP